MYSEIVLKSGLSRSGFGIFQLDDDLFVSSPCCGAHVIRVIDVPIEDKSIRGYKGCRFGGTLVSCVLCENRWKGFENPVYHYGDNLVNIKSWIYAWTDMTRKEVEITLHVDS